MAIRRRPSTAACGAPTSSSLPSPISGHKHLRCEGFGIFVAIVAAWPSMFLVGLIPSTTPPRPLPDRDIADSSRTGVATNIISGVATA
jgi:hypothetical protein